MEYFVPMLGLALLGLVAGWPAPENDKLHKHMTSEESVEAFNSEGPDFPEYDVVPIHLPKSSEKADRVRVKAFGRSIDLELSPNNEVLIDKDTPIYLLREDTTRPAGFTYSRTSIVMGAVQRTMENLKSEASLLVKRSANGEQTISGHIGSESWIIRPVPERLRPRFNIGHENTSATDSTPVYHFVYKTHPSPVGPDYFTVQLCEEWALANSRECVEGVVGGLAGPGAGHEDHDDVASTTSSASEATFTLKYLGSTLVETPSSEEATAEAIKTVITMAKASGKKLQRVALAVSLRGIRMTDLTTEEDQLEVSIYRISYCSADATHDHVFAFIATNMNETMECHAFLCPKKKTAQTVTLTVARAFNTAYEAWQLSQADPRIHHAQDKSPLLDDDRIETPEKIDNERKQSKDKQITQEDKDQQKNLLIDLSNETKKVENSWVCFEEDAQNSLPAKKTVKKPATGNSIPMTTIRHPNNNPTPSHHVVPRPTPGFKVQNAWGESHSVDLMCS